MRFSMMSQSKTMQEKLANNNGKYTYLLEEKPGSASYQVRCLNNTYIGDIYMEVDGRYVFSPREGMGFWNSIILREIADNVDTLNGEMVKTGEQTNG